MLLEARKHHCFYHIVFVGVSVELSSGAIWSRKCKSRYVPVPTKVFPLKNSTLDIVSVGIACVCSDADVVPDETGLLQAP